MTACFSCFLAISATCRLNIAEDFDNITHKVLGKQQLIYTAQHIVILQPNLIHSGVSHSDLRCAGENMRCFISVGDMLSANNDQKWFVERDNEMNITSGARDLKYAYKLA